MTDQAEVDPWFEREMPNAATRPLFEKAAQYKIGFYLGYAELTPDGHHYNTAILVDRDGKIVGKYRKVHLPGHSEFDPERAFQHLEKRYFEPGNLGFPVWRTMDGIFGMAVCNDRRWPETYRVMGLQGVEMVVLGYNTPSVNSQKAEEGPEKRLFHHNLSVQAGAYQNSTFVIATAKCGVEDGHPLFGGSCIVNPDGEIIAARRPRTTSWWSPTRSRRHDLQQGNDLRLQAPPPHRALRPHHQSDRCGRCRSNRDMIHDQTSPTILAALTPARPLQAADQPRDPAADRAGHDDRADRRGERRAVLVLQHVQRRSRRSACSACRRKPGGGLKDTSGAHPRPRRVRGQSGRRGARRADEPVRDRFPARDQRDRRREAHPAAEREDQDAAHRRGAGRARMPPLHHAGGEPRAPPRDRRGACTSMCATACGTPRRCAST